MHGRRLFNKTHEADVLLKIMSTGKLELKASDESVLTKMRKQKMRKANKEDKLKTPETLASLTT